VSSLSHLHRLPSTALKIDRSRDELLLPDGRHVESILRFRTLRTSVVAEGIEDRVQARELVGSAAPAAGLPVSPAVGRRRRSSSSSPTSRLARSGCHRPTPARPATLVGPAGRRRAAGTNPDARAGVSVS